MRMLWQYSLMVALFAAGSRGLLAQCGAGDVLNWTNYVIRQDGNTVYSYSSSYFTGPDTPYWQPYLSTWFQKDSSVLAYFLNDTVAPGGTVSRWYTQNLQIGGTGQYYTKAYFSAYNAACSFGAPPYSNGWNGYNTTASMLVSQPTISGVSAFWWLGPGILSDRGYYAQSALTANPNGAPGTPTWSVSTVSGGGGVSLQCSVCATNTATSTAPSNGCVFDVTVSLSYAGFMSKPFGVKIVTPKNTTFQSVTDSPWNSGYKSITTWALTDTCGNPNSGLDVNEQFGFWTNDVGNNWPLPSATSEYYSNNMLQDTLGAWGTFSPPTSNPQNPLSAAKVMHDYPWNYFVGTQTFGKGVVVHSDTQQFYIDHGRHR